VYKLLFIESAMAVINHLIPKMKHSTQSQVALHLMVDRLTVKTLPIAVRKGNILINEIAREIYVKTDAGELSIVLGNLLETIVQHTCDSRIRISAKTYGNVMLLHIKEDSRLNSPAFASSLVDVQRLADKIGGCVSVTSYRNMVTTVALSFLNLPAAA
jgi:signal transduction histidine kinase